ncbi:MAG TPA: pyruvate, phosphate dikinase [Polyangiaceae bacterium]
MSKHVYFFGEGRAEGDPMRRDLLGGKGAGLAEMTSLGLPVPPGFTISTEACNAYANAHEHVKGLEKEVAHALARVEESVGSKLGDAQKPLLVSVRSGARASMPGMMDTILNLGLNDETAEGLAKASKNRRFAMDAYRRFVAMYASIALGLDKEPFDHALDEARARVAVTKKIDASRMNPEELKRAVPDSDLPEEELEGLVRAFKKVVKDKTGKDFPSDPKAQLWGAIEAVFASWNNARAVYYRKLHDIPDDWGTACNVQAMVFGNLGDDSATGVAFTRNPSTGQKELFGEWLPNAQGEDVVAGIRTPLPIRSTGKKEALEEKMPLAFAQLRQIADKLEHHFRDMQDLEFTIQNGKLYMLQCRNGKRTSRAAVRIAVEMVREKLIDQKEAVLRVEPESLHQLLHPTLDPSAPKELLARGLAASPGAASGAIVFDADEAKKRSSQGTAVILMRVETSPEDIQGMQVSRGILTARGGMTSHAAVVARGMGKPCVAGTTSVQVRYDNQTATFTLEGGGTKVLKKGDAITIDGGTGEVFLGAVATVPAGLFPELEELMKWADESRSLRVRANADTPHDARTARAFGAEGIGLCRTEHMFFGEERITAVREMILAETKEERELALAKLLPFQRNDFTEIFRAMDGLPVTIRLLDPPLHEFLPTEPKQMEQVAQAMGVTAAVIAKRSKDLHEQNPMLGHRGCRLAITFPEIYAMQARAILEAAKTVKKEGVDVHPEIMIPLAISKAELDVVKRIVDEVALKVGDVPAFAFGTMIELPRAAILADELAETAEFFSFGTNDLTQATMGLSRDDAGRFLPAYVEQGILPKDPFVSIDTVGVGELVKLAVERGRETRAKIKLGVCGEHGGDPASIAFFHSAGLAYVSCSPFRVIIARLAAAQVAVKKKSGHVGTA